MKNSTIKPPITWFGSKSRLVKKIVAHFPKHKTYVDVFGGSGAILLGKKASEIEVYNDINTKLVSLFRVLSDPHKSQELIRRLEYTPYSRSEFESCRDNIDFTTYDIELARMFMVVQRQSHAGLGKSWSYCIDSSAANMSASVRKFHAGIERITSVHQRIRKVQIENLSWEEIIKRYDTDNTLFYLDPPYLKETRVGGEYEYELDSICHKELIETILSLKGKFILSGYDNKLYKKLEVAGWNKIEIDTIAFSSSNKSNALRIECLWLSPNCIQNNSHSTEIDLLNINEFTKRQIHAYNIHKQRTDESTNLILKAISSIKRQQKRVTKAEVSRITGISRVHLSRRYSNIFINTK